MTGFARAQGQNERCSWTWEIRSVNGRGLDVRCRLPAGFDHLDQPVRERAASRFKRGNVTFSLAMKWISREGGFRVNRELLDEVIALLPEIRRRIPDAAPPRVDGIFAVRGVVETLEDEMDEEAEQALAADILATLDGAFDSLEKARRSEGLRLAAIVGEQLDEIDNLRGQAEAVTAIQPAAIRERLAKQISALLADAPGLSEERLTQEAALLMTKADPREELDRLRVHVEAARALLAEGKAVGRRLDFLCQEFNREANTLCSKASDVDLTRIGLALKAVIDQMREQVQNVE